MINNLPNKVANIKLFSWVIHNTNELAKGDLVSEIPEDIDFTVKVCL